MNRQTKFYNSREEKESSRLIKTGRWVLACLWAISIIVIGIMVLFWVNADTAPLLENKNKTEISVDELLLKSNYVTENATLVNLNLNVEHKDLEIPLQNESEDEKTQQRKKIYNKILADKIQKVSGSNTSEDFSIRPVPK